MDSPEDRRKLLLISNSVCHGRPYLEHCAYAIRQFLGGATTITFVPYAAKDWDGYTGQVRSALAGFGFKAPSTYRLTKGFSSSLMTRPQRLKLWSSIQILVAILFCSRSGPRCWLIWRTPGSSSA